MAATLVARNANEAAMAIIVGTTGVCVLQESGFSRHKDVFIFNLPYTDFYKVCTFNAICKDNIYI
jgi:hypothetical protein